MIALRIDGWRTGVAAGLAALFSACSSISIQSEAPSRPAAEAPLLDASTNAMVGQPGGAETTPEPGLPAVLLTGVAAPAAAALPPAATSEPSTSPPSSITTEAVVATTSQGNARPFSSFVDPLGGSDATRQVWGRSEGLNQPRTEPSGGSPPAAIDPLQPGVRINPNEHDVQVDLWDRLRGGFNVVDLEGDLVRAREQWYAARPDYVQRMIERGGRYLFHILQEVERRGLPSELALLPFIESAFNPQALSSARASGMWQFMPSTGRTFDLKQNVFRDDRRDVLASTRAALDYLEKLHAMFDDWHLALAAYNWGEGNVARAIARNRKAGRPADYSSLKMPNETRQYVPKLQAVKNIVARPDVFGLVLPALANHPYFLSVPIERDIDVELAARLAGLSVDEFRALNPQMNKPVILAAGTPQILLPYDNANRFVRGLGMHHGRLASWTAWVTPKTLKPAEAARQVGMAEAQLRELNTIPERMLIKGGSTLLVPRSELRQADVSEHLADNATMALAPDGAHGRRMALRAGKRESVASVARRFGVRPEHVAHWNSVDVAAAFRPGQKVIVFVASKVTRANAARAPGAVQRSRPASAARTPAHKGWLGMSRN